MSRLAWSLPFEAYLFVCFEGSFLVLPVGQVVGVFVVRGMPCGIIVSIRHDVLIKSEKTNLVTGRIWWGSCPRQMAPFSCHLGHTGGDPAGHRGSPCPIWHLNVVLRGALKGFEPACRVPNVVLPWSPMGLVSMLDEGGL